MDRIFKKYSTLSIVTGATLWGLIGIFVRRLSAAGLNSIETMMIRCVFAALVMLLYLGIFDRKSLRVRPRDLWMFFGTGIISFLTFGCCYFAAITLTSMSIAAMLLYTSPVFVTIMAAIFFGEKITKTKIAAICAALLGSTFIAGGFGSSAPNAKGIFFGLMSGLCYALYSIFSRIALKRYSEVTITAYTFVFAAIGSIFAADLAKVSQIITTDFSLIPFSILFALITAVFPYILYTGGLKYTSTTSAAVTACIEPVVASVSGLILFKEAMSTSAIVGSVLILGAVFIQSLKSHN